MEFKIGVKAEVKMDKCSVLSCAQHITSFFYSIEDLLPVITSHCSFFYFIITKLYAKACCFGKCVSPTSS